MSEDICGVPLSTRGGVCEASPKHPDGKCGIHSEHNGFNAVQEASNELISEHLEDKRGKMKDSTFKGRRTALLAFDDYLSEKDISDVIEGVDFRDIEGFTAWLLDSRELAESSAKDYTHNISGFYEWILKIEKQKGNRIENPVTVADWQEQLPTNGTPEKKRILGEREEYFAPSEEQVETLIDNAQPPDRFRSQLIMKCLAQTGARPHELRNIRLSGVRDSDKPELWENNRIVIHSSKTESHSGDISGTRTVRYNDSLKFYLKKWLESYRRDYGYATKSEYLFPSNRSERISIGVIEDTVKRASRESGLQETIYTDASGRERVKFSPYSFRHFFGSQMATSVEPPELAQLMGSSVQTVNKYYVNLREGQLDHAADVTPDV